MNYADFVAADARRQVPPGHCLGKTGLQAVKDWFNETTELDLRQFRFEPIQALSTGDQGCIRLTAVAMTDEGDVGRYLGTQDWIYTKVPIHTCLPYPIRYSGPYPAQWGYMRYWFASTYGLLFDENDFTLEHDDSPLKDVTLIDLNLTGPGQYLKLSVRDTSLRFQVTDTPLRIVLTPTQATRRSLQGFSEGTVVKDLASIATDAVLGIL